MADLETTRLSLHAVAELLLAGPQYAASGTIKLQVTPAGFATIASPDVSVRGVSLEVDGRLVPMSGRTVREVAADASLAPRGLDDVYSGGSGSTASYPLEIDADAATEIADAFLRGQDALTTLAPDVGPVLWPEHFDLGLAVDEVNYGVSPGDSYLAVPYAYVGPWRPADFTGSFWNAPFGAARPVTEIEDLLAFFVDGRTLTGS